MPWFAKTEAEFKALSTINAKADRLTVARRWRELFAKRRWPVGDVIPPKRVFGNYTLNQRLLRGRLALSNNAIPTATAIPP